MVVDTETAARGPAFDHKRLAAALSTTSGTVWAADKLPFDQITISDDGKTLEFSADGKAWNFSLDTYECGGHGAAETPPADRGDDRESGRPPRPAAEDDEEVEPGTVQLASPDGKWMGSIKDHNVFVRPAAEGEEKQLSTDGSDKSAYRRLMWSPDSKSIVAFRVTPGKPTEVHLIESSPQGGGPAKLHSRLYPLPGDPFDSYELNLFDVATAKQTKAAVEPIDFGWPRLRWKADQRHLMYEKIDRGHQRFRVMEVDSQTGESRTLVDEKSETFIWTAHTESLRLQPVHWLKNTEEAIRVSEKSGWRHLYLVDLAAGEIKNAITSGPYVVRGINLIDEEKRQIWFTASGRNPDQDPYFLHFYRVNFDGSGLVALTEGDGNHTIQYSPDRRFLIDTYSKVDTPAVHELRRVDDGKLVCLLEKADITELKESGWKPPTIFSAKARDGVTDIWGIIVTPRDFDPARKYPVIEEIYAGPQSSYVPKSFSPITRQASLADKGFVVVQLDGMGTANRSKAFHDVCWKNLKDAGFPDRILWMKAAAGKFSYMDLTRVGVYGTSAGGQNAAGAVLFHPEFYKAAVASCGCHDNRMDKYSWNEQWMGYPVGPQYSESSNIDNAGLLVGKLMLIVGELDDNVPPESTYRFVDALIKAGKDFDFLMVPGANHGNGGPYGMRRRDDFFIKHLLSQDPPSRNVTTLGTPAAAPASPAPATSSVTAPPESFFQMVSENDREAARAFYQKYLNVGGLPVVSAGVVDDEALLRTNILVTRLLAGRPDILAEMEKIRMYLIIMGRDQLYTDMPEYRNTRNPAYKNERVRGTGGRPTSFGEENLLNLVIDRYDDESIALHEFCHTIDATLRSLDPTWHQRRNNAYDNAVKNNLYGKNYVSSNAVEYWAEICQSYFDCNRINNWNHSDVGTREQLKQRDPQGYELVSSIFNLTPEQDWRFPWHRTTPQIIAPPARFAIDPFYQKFSWAREMPVIGHKTDDAPLLQANDIVRKVFTYRHDILKAMIEDGVKVVVLAPDERYADLPEIKGIGGAGSENRIFDYDPRTKRVVIAAESLQPGSAGNDGGRELIRQLAKAAYQITAGREVKPDKSPNDLEIQQYEIGVTRIDQRFGTAVKELHAKALAEGKWRDTPAATGPSEYWALGLAAYFSPASAGAPPTAVTSREALREYDSGLHELIRQTMAYEGRPEWRLGR